MQGDDPPFLPVGTDVSAKYKGAFCEAKIKKVVRNIKCKVTVKAGGGTITVNDDVIKGNLRVGSTVEVKQDPKKDAMEAVITKIQDCSQYTVVFDDGDITTLRRSALCLKSGRHFNESETLDQLPLTHPEHFSTPVIAGRRGRRGRAQSEESEGSGSGRRVKADVEPHVGRVVLVEAGGGAERRRPHQPAFPALVVAPTAQIKVKEDYLVRSFKDGRYYTVPKKEAREFRKGSAPLEWAGVEAALQYLNNGVLPPHWDRDTLFNEPRNTSDDSSDDEPREEKDHFVAQLYKFMDERGTPLNRNPTIANKDIDLYRLFKVVEKLGGYNRVTNQNQWKTIADKMGFHPVTTSITNLCKQAYKKFLHSYEDFYRKLGVTLVAHPRGARTPPAGRSLIRDRDRHPPTSSSASASACSTPTGTPTQQRGKDKDSSDKSETDKSEKSEKEEKQEKPEKTKEKPRVSDGEDSADNQPLLATVAPKVEKDNEKDKEKDKDKKEEKEKDKEKEKEKDKEKEKEKEKEKDKEKEKEAKKEKDKERDKSSTSSSTSEEKAVVKPRSQSKGRTITPVKIDHDKRTPKRRSLSSKAGDGASTSTSRASRRPHVSTDSDSSGRASRCGPIKKMQSRRSQSANSASSGNTIASNSSKRPRKRKSTEPSTNEPTRSGVSNVKAQVGDKLKVYYGPTQSESKVTYEAKVIEVSSEGMLRVHYTGWNTRYDEWIKPQRIALNVTQHEQRNKKNTGMNRRARTKRTEESSARSDSDSDSESDEDVKRPSKKSDEKPNSKTPSRSKDLKSSDSSSSSKPRKRPVRTISTPTAASPPKKPRPNVTGRDFDLNEIRSELKGLQTVKQETDETVKTEGVEASSPTASQSNPAPPEPRQSEKQPEDVYEFKEPEPFELELHDEKKKRTHRIFDDISPSKYTSTLSKSLSEEISEDPMRVRPPLRSPSLSPFRDFGSSREVGRHSPEDDSKDGLFSLDDDSFPGDGSSGPTFEGFTPAKNQETYSKKSKVSKLRELIDDSPDSPADDEQSSDDDPEDITIKQEINRDPIPLLSVIEEPKTPEPVLKEEPMDSEPELPPTEEKIVKTKAISREKTPEPPKTPPLQKQSEVQLPKISIVTSISINNTTTTPGTNTAATTVLSPTRIPTPTPNPSSPPIIELKKKEEPKTKPIELPKTKTPELPKTKLDIPKTKTLQLALTKVLELPKTKILDMPKSKPVEQSKPQVLELPAEEPKKEIKKDEPDKLLVIPPVLEPKEKSLIIKLDKKLENAPSEPDSPARIDVLPEPPPGFLLQSEGPKIAEKLLKAISSAKRLSMSPPPSQDRPDTPKSDSIKSSRSDIKLIAISPEPKPSQVKPDLGKPFVKIEPIKKSVENTTESIFGEPHNFVDLKRDTLDIKKPKSDDPVAPRLQSPLNILERRKSVADHPLSVPGKNNKVLSDTIQKLSSQINQSAAAAAASIPLPPFPTEDRSESSDSDDSDRRLIIDKLSVEEWGSGGSSEAVPTAAVVASAATRALHAGKSLGEWSGAESLLMLEDACKNERKHSASVVVAGSGRVATVAAAAACVSGVSGPGEDDSNISLLLCEETIPGSPAPDAEPAPPRQRLHMPFASAPPHHHTHSKEDRRGEGGSRASGAASAGAGASAGEAPGGGPSAAPAREAAWGRPRPLMDNTPPTTPDSSLDMSPHRERRISERDSPSERKEDEDEGQANDATAHDVDKPHGGSRSRKASESSCAGAGRGRTRRSRRDTDEAQNLHHHSHQPPLKYNFYVDLDPTWDCQTRINVLTSRLADLRKAYHSVKAELAAIDRRRKKLRRKEREAVKAAKAACS
ncbi:unnamed protein product [Arctia plantaginis]|uniref:ARID domain-containing protein n=1 Tax=Arctia plantaginis TaxID=874455 RepID=A0A8S1AQ51_ARCPL|nr:unnamed protein product [Arctia plantaginis]